MGWIVRNPLGSVISTSYGYSQRNMLITVTQTVAGTTAAVAEYRYDGDNARYQQIDYSSGITTTYHNDIVGLSQVLIADDGTTQTANLFGLDLIASDDGANTLTMLPDGLGSVRLEMQGGAVSSVITYEPYGTLLMRTGPSGTVYGYTGEQMDGATGLTYLRARYYNPALRLFLSKDPFSGRLDIPLSQHGYIFANANPVNRIDPSGLCTVLMTDYGEGCFREGSGFSPGTTTLAEQNAIFVNRYERAVAAAILTGDTQYLNTLDPLRDNLVEQPYIIDRWVYTAQSAVGSDGSEIILLTAWLGACGATPTALGAGFDNLLTDGTGCPNCRYVGDLLNKAGSFIRGLLPGTSIPMPPSTNSAQSTSVHSG